MHILLKYSPSKERQQGHQIEFTQLYLWSKYVNASIFYTPILILMDLRLFCRRPSTSSCCDARNYRKILVMEIQILSRNYGQISSKYFLYLGGSKSNNFHWFATVWPWLKILTTPVLKKRVLQTCLYFLWKLEFTAWIGLENHVKIRNSTAPVKRKLKQRLQKAVR